MTTAAEHIADIESLVYSRLHGGAHRADSGIADFASVSEMDSDSTVFSAAMRQGGGIHSGMRCRFCNGTGFSDAFACIHCCGTGHSQSPFA